MKLEFITRACPLCGGEDARVMVESTLHENRLTASAFASRKVPEYMHSRMVECRLCGMLYANPVLRPRVEAVCRAAGYEPPLICTPEELSTEVADDG